jgi:hypothetical protein
MIPRLQERSMHTFPAIVLRRLLAATLAAFVVLPSAAAYAAGGHDFALPLGPKHPSGLTLHVDCRGIDANGYRPVRVTVATWPPNKPLTADRQVRVALSFYGYNSRKSQISQVIELPEGSASVTATILVPQIASFSAISIDTFEGGEKLKELSSDSMGFPNTHGGDWTEARPALLFIDSHVPPRDDRLDLVKAFEATAIDSSPTYTLPDVRSLLSLSPDFNNPRTLRNPRGRPPTTSTPATTSRMSDTALLTMFAARPRAEMIPPAELAVRWIELSQYDAAIISFADLQQMVKSQPRQLASLRDWFSTGPLLIVYGCGKNFAQLPDLERLLELPPLMGDDKSPSALRGWTAPTLESRTGPLQTPLDETADAVPIPPPGQASDGDALRPAAQSEGRMSPASLPQGPLPFVFRRAATGSSS